MPDNRLQTKPDKRDQAGIASCLSRCETHYRKLDAHLEHRPYLAGAALTMADIPSATSLYRYFEMGVPVPALPNLVAWYDRLTQRPAYREHVMISFQELRGRLAF